MSDFGSTESTTQWLMTPIDHEGYAIALLSYLPNSKLTGRPTREDTPAQGRRQSRGRSGAAPRSACLWSGSSSARGGRTLGNMLSSHAPIRT